MGRHNALERLINTFKTDEHNLLTSLVELDRSGEFEVVDVDISEEIEDWYEEIRVFFSRYSEKSESKYKE